MVVLIAVSVRPGFRNVSIRQLYWVAVLSRIKPGWGWHFSCSHLMKSKLLCWLCPENRRVHNLRKRSGILVNLIVSTNWCSTSWRIPYSLVTWNNSINSVKFLTEPHTIPFNLSHSLTFCYNSPRKWTDIEYSKATCLIVDIQLRPDRNNEAIIHALYRERTSEHMLQFPWP